MAEHPLGSWLREGGHAAEPTPRAGQDPAGLDPAGQDPAGQDPAGQGPAERPGRRRLPLLAAAAAVPWALAALAIAVGGGDRPEEDAARRHHAAAAPGAPADAALDADDGDQRLADPAHGGPPRVPEGGDGTGAGGVPADVAAAAAAAVRLEVSGLAADDGRARHVDLALPEAAEAAGDLWVVTVLAVVLEGTAEAWTDTVAWRFAVPVRLAAQSGPALAGAPWRVPGPALAPGRPPDWQPHTQPAPGVAEALEAAGFSGVRDLATDGAPEAPLLRAVFAADHPEGRHEVWLRADPEEPHVLGLGPGTPDETDWNP